MKVRAVSVFLASCVVLSNCAPPAASQAPPSAPTTPTNTSAPTATPAPPTPTEVPPTATATPTPAPHTTTAEPAFDLALVGGALIDGSGSPPLPDAVVLLRGDRIAAVGQVGQLAIPPGTPTRDLRGMTILPGFINAHVHTDTLSDDDMKRWTAAGITTIRDLGGPRAPMLQRRAALAAANDLAFPRMLAAGPIITVPGGHPIPVYGPSDEVLTVRGPDDARAQVNTLIDAGADVIKIAVSGRTDVNWPELSDDEIRAIVEAAHARGVKVAAHIDRAVALERAVQQGIDDAAHMPRDRMPNDLVAEMAAQSIALVPTIDVYEALAEQRGQGEAWRQTTLPVMQDNLRRFARAGGVLALGDDYGNPGIPLGMPLAEMRHWLAAGLSPMQVIVAATHGGATVCGLAEEIGLVRPGMAADLLAVPGDPLADIDVLARPALVVHGGVVVLDTQN